MNRFARTYFLVVLLLTGGLLVAVTRSSTPPPAAAPAPRVVPTRAAPPPSPSRRTLPNGSPLRGRVLDANGRPLAGARVTVRAHQSTGDSLAVLFSFGAACLSTPSPCDDSVYEGTTDARGRYDIDVPAKVAKYELTASGPAGSVSTTITYPGMSDDAPQLRMWSPRPRVTRSGHTLRVRYARPPSSLGEQRSAFAIVTTPGGEVLSADLAHGATLDARWFEDLAVTVSVHVAVKKGDRYVGYRSGVPLRGTTRAISRGRPCTFAPGGRVPRCPLTDGDLTTTAATPDTCGRCAVTVDLGGVRTVRHVFVHGCDEFDVRVETSVDGRRWRPLELPGCDGAVGRSARHVRLPSLPTGTSELSVF